MAAAGTDSARGTADRGDACVASRVGVNSPDRALSMTRGVKFERIVRATGSGTSALVQLGCEEVDLVDDVAVGTGAVGDRRLRRAQLLPS